MTADKPLHFAPKLRFPEFRDTPGWSKRQLGEFLTQIVRKLEKPAVPYTGLGIRSHGRGTFRKELERPEKNSMDHLYEVDCDDLIVNITFAWEGAIAIVRSEDAGALVSHRFPTYQFDQNAVLADFFRYPILDRQFIYNLGVISPGGAGRNRVLNKADFLKIELALPEVAEQQKVADCLGSQDDLIAAEGRKLEALRQHKQGLMQQLFPQPGETVPRLRFPEFRDAGQWEPKRLERIGELVGGGTPDTTVPEYWGGDIQWFTPSEVKDRNLSKSKRTISSEGLNNSSAKLLPIGTLLITTRASIGDIGIADSPCATNQGFQSLIVAESEVNTFWYYWLVQHSNELTKRASGSTFLEIGKTELKKIPVLRPDDDEQRKIADCLGSLDGLITAEGRKLEALRQHKQGLMQQLFPLLDEQ